MHLMVSPIAATMLCKFTEDCKRDPDPRPWVQTATGGRMPIPTAENLEIAPDLIDFRDVALQLSGQTRFNGALHIRWSTAQHCLWVADQIWQETRNAQAALYGLLHDVHETWLGDIPSPVKCAMSEAARADLLDKERAYDHAVFAAAGLPIGMSKVARFLVKKYDWLACVREGREGYRSGLRPDWDTRGADVAEFNCCDFVEDEIEVTATRFLAALAQLGGPKITLEGVV